ncbi:hypothetical protein IJ818_07215 [bacterium]|nr:hypothetical protein [bacterium]
MKRYCVLGIIIFCLSGVSYAYGSYSAVITPIENSFYGIDYAEEADEQRLERLEETVYGSAQKGDIKTRLNKLKKDISAELIGKEIEAKPDTFADDTPKTTYTNTGSGKSQEIFKEDPNISYPVVDTMENIVFKKQFKNNDINNRLTKLESEVYNQVYPNEDLYTRVDRLKKTLLIEEIPQLAHYDDVFGDTDTPSYEDYENYVPTYPRAQNASSSDYDNSLGSSNYSNQDYGNVSESDLNLAIEKLEKAILKRKHKNEDNNTRLSRIENKMFSTNFEEDDTNTRLNRIATAYQAQKSSKKYMGMDLQEKLSTVMQIGMTVLFILAMVL